MDDGRLEDVKTRGREDVSEGTDAAARRSEPFGGTPKGTRGIRLRSEATAGQARVLPGIGALGRLHAGASARAPALQDNQTESDQIRPKNETIRPNPTESDL
jgi:hypothetical protein